VWGRGSVDPMATRRAVVTGASSGIGEATARMLRSGGWDVVAVARRADRLERLEAETGAVAFAADLTVDADVAALADWLADSGEVHSLVHIAGGARGTDRVEDADPGDWRWMFEVNALSAQRLVAALMPLLRAGAASSGHADAVFVTSTAAQTAYAGGVGYNAAKAAEAMVAHGLRLELNGEPIRVIEVAPGMVRTDEFTLNRLGGDRDAADAVYAGVEHPLTAEDVADVIAYALGTPGHVNLDLITMRPVAQSAQHLLARGPLRPRIAP
jgi:NADP-dependent 3-hydroxy acid dehydrogenase YdfG